MNYALLLVGARCCFQLGLGADRRTAHRKKVFMHSPGPVASSDSSRFCSLRVIDLCREGQFTEGRLGR